MSRLSTAARRLRGFTVLEFLVAMGVAGIVSAIAVPNLGTLVLNTRRTTLLNDLVATVQMARTSAGTRGRVVVVCPSSDGATCGAPAAWNDGWIVFVNLDEAFDERGPHEPLLRHFQTGPGQEVRVNMSGRTETLQMRPFHYHSSNGTITVCDRRGAVEARAVILNVMGRPYVSARAAGGGALAC